MCRKYFFKNKGCLSRKFIASGLSAVFSAGMFSSYAGAMEEELFKDSGLDFEQFLKDDVEREKMGTNSRKRLLENFSIEAYVQNYANEYDRLIGEKK